MVTLQIIASQCPYTGGNGVYEARAILSLLNDSVDYSASCDTYDPTVNTSARIAKPVAETTDGFVENQVAMQRLKLYPNPNNGEFTCELINDLIVEATFIIYDVLGQVTQTQVIQSGTTKINLKDVPSGIYKYCIKVDEGEDIIGKIVITK